MSRTLWRRFYFRVIHPLGITPPCNVRPGLLPVCFVFFFFYGSGSFPFAWATLSCRFFFFIFFCTSKHLFYHKKYTIQTIILNGIFIFSCIFFSHWRRFSSNYRAPNAYRITYNVHFYQCPFRFYLFFGTTMLCAV